MKFLKLLSNDRLRTSLHKKRILIVDDEPLIVRTVISLLIKNGFEDIRTELDSRFAVEAIRQLKPDVVLLDIHMPHLTGLEILEHMNDEREFENVHVLMHSAASEEEVAISFELGASGFIRKPSDEISIVDKIKSTLMASVQA
jgi:CheY-like chemotaxis protein